MNKKFDWQTFMALYFPCKLSTASQDQQDRQTLYEVCTLPDLSAWATRHNLQTIWGGDIQSFNKYLRGCAFAGAARARDPHHSPTAVYGARYVFWYAAVDRYIDNNLAKYLADQGWSLDQKSAYLDRRLAHICKPLYTFGMLTHLQAQEARLIPDPSLEKTAFRLDAIHTDTVIRDQTDTDLTDSLREALVDLYRGLDFHILACQGTARGFIETPIWQGTESILPYRRFYYCQFPRSERQYRTNETAVDSKLAESS